jgi:quercetin dioxygenase-like cupin family protein
MKTQAPIGNQAIRGIRMTASVLMGRLRIGLVVAVGALALSMRAHGAIAQIDRGFGICVPRAQRGADSVGCFIVVDRPVGRLDATPVFWFVSRLASRVRPTAALPARSTIIDAFGSSWLLAVGDAKSAPHDGTLVATIGPLPIAADHSYSALYMEASMRPGMKSAIHRHSGPEAWYTLSGETCLETPSGAMVGRAGGPPVIVPGGGPMELTATGTGIRRSLVLILHDSLQPPTTMETTWKPRGLCNAPAAGRP